MAHGHRPVNLDAGTPVLPPQLLPTITADPAGSPLVLPCVNMSLADWVSRPDYKH